MAATVIRVENLSKQYRLGEIGTGALSHDLKRWWYQLRGKPDPFAKIGEVNDRATKGSSDYVWALQDINFEVKQGEVLGIIGKNGAGKSTLLKILSKTTTPTTGSVKIKGRIASLLEVGTGFHPELSGRENIFLNGAILGMTKREIKAKFDEIVDFSGVERYIDTPVKRYSSGMYVRLAFAVAAFLESEVLIVDEVLAVGDIEFQKKCIGRMSDISARQGRTVLFVSHNMSAVQKLCTQACLLDKGRFVMSGDVKSIVGKYVSELALGGRFFKEIDESRRAQLVELYVAEVREEDLIFSTTIYASQSIDISIDMQILDSVGDNVGFASVGTFDYGKMLSLQSGENEIMLSLDTSSLAEGNYICSIDLTKPNIEYYDRNEKCLSFEIVKKKDALTRRRLLQSWNYGSVQFNLVKI